MNTDTEKTGVLRYIGRYKLAHQMYDYFRCVDCGTEFPQIGGSASCNGRKIARCPWCRPDSKPWTAGRGN